MSEVGLTHSSDEACESRWSEGVSDQSLLFVETFYALRGSMNGTISKQAEGDNPRLIEEPYAGKPHVRFREGHSARLSLEKNL